MMQWIIVNKKQKKQLKNNREDNKRTEDDSWDRSGQESWKPDDSPTNVGCERRNTQ